MHGKGIGIVILTLEGVSPSGEDEVERRRQLKSKQYKILWDFTHM